MIAYRLYFLDAAGHILRRREFELASDADAIAKACELDHAHRIEIWDGKRHVTVVEPGADAA